VDAPIPVVASDANTVVATSKVDAEKPTVRPVPEMKLLTVSSRWIDEGSMKMTMLVFPFEPKVGSSVTVLPRNGLRSLNLKITDV